MATLYTHKAENNFKTILLMGVFLTFFVGIGYVASQYYGNPGILYGAVIFSIIANIGSYWFSDKLALAVNGAKEADSKEFLELHRIVENLAITAGLPKPRVYIIEDSAPNAFATGRNKEHAAIAVTAGLLQILDKSELEGVIAHELGHIGNKDILLQSVVAVLVGSIAMIADFIIRISWHRGNDNDNKTPIFAIVGIVLMILSPIIATLIQLAISRKREFLADATGALMTRYPEGLANALHKISDYHGPMNKMNKATAHMFISTPLGGDADGDGIPDKEQKVSFLSKMFMTHPPVQERIKALLNK